MKLFASNIAHLRNSRGFAQAEMLDKLGFPRTTWAAYEKSKAEPSLQNLIRISDFFGVPVEDLLVKDLSAADALPAVPTPSDRPQLVPLPSAVITQSTPEWEHPENNVYDLESAAAAGPGAFMQEIDKRATGPNLYIPDLGQGLHIRVPITGDSMHPTVKNGDKVVATRVQHIKDIFSGYVHVLIDEDDGILCKRVYQLSSDMLELVSDNPSYPPLRVPIQRFVGIFRIEEIHTKDLYNYGHNLGAVWEEIAQIKRALHMRA